MAYSFQEEESNGIKTVYSLDFTYISRSDVRVYKGSHPLPVPMAFQWVDDSTIELTNIQVDAPDKTKFWIRRIMPREALLHIFANKSIRPVTLDQQNYQALYLLQELADGFSSLDGVMQVNNNLDMNNNFITDLANPVAPQDASTKAYTDAQNAADRVYSDEQDTLLSVRIRDLDTSKVDKAGDTMTGQLLVPLQSIGDNQEVLSSFKVQEALDTMQRSLLDLIQYPANIEDYGFVEVIHEASEDFGMITDPVTETVDRGRLTATGLA
ncbi:tail fiber protein [Vibrio phage K436]